MVLGRPKKSKKEDAGWDASVGGEGEGDGMGPVENADEGAAKAGKNRMADLEKAFRSKLKFPHRMGGKGRKEMNEEEEGEVEPREGSPKDVHFLELLAGIQENEKKGEEPEDDGEGKKGEELSGDGDNSGNKEATVHEEGLQVKISYKVSKLIAHFRFRMEHLRYSARTPHLQ